VQVKEVVEDNRLEGEEEEGDLWHGSDFKCDVRVVMFCTLNVMLDL
jgi:hypothetical protein